MALNSFKEKSPGCQSIFDNSGNCLFFGEWDPRALIQVICASGIDLNGKVILDIGANTGGLSIELARLGAKQVILSEPGPPLGKTHHLVSRIIESEGLSVEVQSYDLYSCLERYRSGDIDVVVLFGLIYHFRNPQDILDKLNIIAPELLISNQTHPGNSEFMMNRVSKGVMKEGFMPDDLPLSGWHPTKRCFELMLEIAGFRPTLLTPRTIDFPRKLNGLTNSSYYYCERFMDIDPKANSTYYPR
jgi:SAM-dependent methyltransferase